ncbi:MauE/DoxX family redox-associated membrane protein [Mucilaginibacter paludis]|uniref:Methylamine utilisation protein MauE domain-containing protein n=1 Tax=Mucilaginibacter paludis DSM 18603 TaxID=714943 RepID=H1YGX0_9SPHI|nr:MauE/DoxX family redox-associated membrane protein [Mucilaginibacter paludis]EHQ26399.1 hypothetical protein Mucpa_2266 [Mucilaginibacter paludis DSM 18603]
MKKQVFKEFLIAALVLLFIYASFSKYADFPYFQQSMHRQPFPSWMSDLLIWLIPPFEIIIAGLLAFWKTRLYGLIAFISLMGIFTLYITAILMNIFPIVPCSCGGIIQSFGWLQHLFFNLVFILIAGIALTINSKELKKDKVKTEINLKNAYQA